MKKKDAKNTPANSNKVPAGALCLGYEGATAITEFSGEGDQKTPQLNMVIYSGGIIKNHWYWDDLAMDLTGMSLPKKKFPILEGHDRDKKIAFHDGPPIIDKNLRVDPSKVSFVSTTESQEFQTLSSEGFPYEASARVKPTVIERVSEGAFAEVNGFKLKGPATVFRKWELVEGSVCVFGYDRNTESAAFSDEVELNCEFLGEEEQHKFSNQEGVKKIMDRETLKKEHPDLYEQIRADAFAEVKPKIEAEFSTQVTEIQGTVTSLQETVQAQTKTIDGLKNTNLDLQKDNALRAEEGMKAKADAIWVTKFSDCDIPKHLQDERITDRVTHCKFVDPETKACDWVKFSEAVDVEIKKWEDDLGKFSSSIKGGGYTKRTDADDDRDETELKAENDWVDEMLSLVEDPEENGGEK